jgi:dihydrofolate reductase
MNAMKRIIVSAWVTLDGVFDAETMQHWFFPYDSTQRQEYIKNGILKADTILFGRTTYEMLASFWPHQKNDDMGPASKLNSVDKFVVSTTLKKTDWNNTRIINKNIIGEIAKLKQQPGTEIQIEGSATLVKSLMGTNLIDEFRFLVHPVIMGGGKKFFIDGMPVMGLKLVKTETFDKGVVLLCFQPAEQ